MGKTLRPHIESTKCPWWYQTKNCLNFTTLIIDQRMSWTLTNHWNPCTITRWQNTTSRRSSEGGKFLYFRGWKANRSRKKKNVKCHQKKMLRYSHWSHSHLSHPYCSLRSFRRQCLNPKNHFISYSHKVFDFFYLFKGLTKIQIFLSNKRIRCN